jgi:hypothetical protein
MRPWIAVVAAAVAAGTMAGCGSGDGGDGTTSRSLPQGSERVDLDPAHFTTTIDNPYLPMPVGRVWVLRETDGDGEEQRVTITVTPRTTTIMGIEARVVTDVVTKAGAPVEVTEDWFAQDRDGNVWYLGEDTTEYEDGRPVTTAGSWRAGVGGAQPGIAMPAAPVPGLSYRQEYLAGEAEDAATVLSVTATATVPAGTYTGVLRTRDVTPLDPGLVEHKLYARGVGPIGERIVAGGEGRAELLSVTG